MPIAHWRTGVLQRPECMYASVCTCTVHFPLVTAQAPAAKHSNLVALQSCTVYCSLPHHLTGVDEQICLTPSPTPCLAAAPLHTCSPISHESCFVHPPKATEPNGVHLPAIFKKKRQQWPTQQTCHMAGTSAPFPQQLCPPLSPTRPA